MRHHRSITSKFVTPTAPSCIDNSWRSTTLPAADSAVSSADSRVVLFQLLSIHDRTVGVTNLGVMLLCAALGGDELTQASKWLQGFQVKSPSDQVATQQTHRTRMAPVPMTIHIKISQSQKRYSVVLFDFFKWLKTILRYFVRSH